MTFIKTASFIVSKTCLRNGILQMPMVLPRIANYYDRLMQTCEKGTHFSQHICLVRQKDVMVSMRQYDHTAEGTPLSNASACSSVSAVGMASATARSAGVLKMSKA